MGCVGGDAKFEDIGAVEDFWGKHVGGFVDVHRSDDENVPWEGEDFGNISGGEGFSGQRMAFSVEEEGAVGGFHGAEEVGEVAFDVGKVHLVEDEEERELGLKGGGEKQVENACGLVEGSLFGAVGGGGEAEMVDEAEDIAVVRPIGSNGNEGDLSGGGGAEPVGEEFGEFCFACAGVASEDGWW